MTNFSDKQSVLNFRSALQADLNEIAKKHGVKLSLGNATFTSTNITFKLEAATLNENGEANSKTVTDWNLCAPFYGFKPEHLNSTFRSNGKTVKIVGWDRKSHKYPVLGEVMGKTYKFQKEVVQRALGLPVNTGLGDFGVDVGFGN
jgi:hypothetical protein